MTKASIHRSFLALVARLRLHKLERLIEKHSSVVVGSVFFLSMVYVGHTTVILQKTTTIKKPLRLVVQLETAEGMKIGAPVLIHGVQKGVVSAFQYMALDQTGRPVPWKAKLPPDRHIAGQTVVAVLDLTDQVTFYANYRIITRYPNVFAAKEVDIDPGRAPAKTLDFLDLDSQQLVDFRSMGSLPLDGAVARVSNYDDPMFLISSVLGENRHNLRTIASNIRQATDKINEGTGTAGEMLDQRTLNDDSNRLMVTLLVLVSEIREGLEDTRESGSSIDALGALFTFALKAATGGL
ncbi:MAG: MCE family protein [Spirochaetia bacterium]|nr:MCE family protein [Spirochaetia bacterium]